MILFNVSVCAHVCMCTRVGTRGGQKRAWESLELELQEVMSYTTWILGTEFWFLARVASALTSELSTLLRCLMTAYLINGCSLGGLPT